MTTQLVQTPYGNTNPDTAKALMGGVPQGGFQPVPLTGYWDIPRNLIGSDFTFYNPNTEKPESIKMVSRSIAQNPATQSSAIGAVTPVTKESGLSKTGIGIMAAGSAIGDIASGYKQAGTNEYLMDVAYWKEQGKDWFDKGSDYFPTFDDYAGGMPSATDAVNPAATVIGRTGVGAATGMIVGGPVGAAVGAGVGALVGAVESIFSTDSAKEEDKKNKERAMREYETKLKQWSYARLSRFKEEKAKAEAGKRDWIRGSAQAGIAAKKEKAGLKEKRRQQLIESFLGAGSIARKEREQNQTRWAA